MSEPYTVNGEIGLISVLVSMPDNPMLSLRLNGSPDRLWSVRFLSGESLTLNGKPATIKKILQWFVDGTAEKFCVTLTVNDSLYVPVIKAEFVNGIDYAMRTSNLIASTPGKWFDANEVANVLGLDREKALYYMSILTVADRRFVYSVDATTGERLVRFDPNHEGSK